MIRCNWGPATPITRKEQFREMQLWHNISAEQNAIDSANVSLLMYYSDMTMDLASQLTSLHSALSFALLTNRTIILPYFHGDTKNTTVRSHKSGSTILITLFLLETSFVGLLLRLRRVRKEFSRSLPVKLLQIRPWEGKRPQIWFSLCAYGIVFQYNPQYIFHPASAPLRLPASETGARRVITVKTGILREEELLRWFRQYQNEKVWLTFPLLTPLTNIVGSSLFRYLSFVFWIRSQRKSCHFRGELQSGNCSCKTYTRQHEKRFLVASCHEIIYFTSACRCCR